VPTQPVLSETELNAMIDSIEKPETKKKSSKNKSKGKGKSKK
jgi:hypothetical protein